MEDQPQETFSNGHDPASRLRAPLQPVGLWRSTDALRANDIINDPSIRPHVANDEDGVLDIGRLVTDQSNVVLMGEHGFLCFVLLQPGIYEVHVHILPPGRGRWALAMAESCVRWMFTRTPCYEMLAPIMTGNVMARALAISAGARLEFTRPGGARYHNRAADADIYALRLQDWYLRAPWIRETGELARRAIAAEVARLNGTEPDERPDDEVHDRVLGVTYEIARYGRLAKAVMFYNRWAAIARVPPIWPLAEQPPTIRTGAGTFRIVGDEIQGIASS